MSKLRANVRQSPAISNFGLADTSDLTLACQYALTFSGTGVVSYSRAPTVETGCTNKNRSRNPHPVISLFLATSRNTSGSTSNLTTRCARLMTMDSLPIRSTIAVSLLYPSFTRSRFALPSLYLSARFLRPPPDVDPEK